MSRFGLRRRPARGTEAAGVGHTTAYRLVLSLGWCAGIVIGFGGVAAARFARSR